MVLGQELTLSQKLLNNWIQHLCWVYLTSINHLQNVGNCNNYLLVLFSSECGHLDLQQHQRTENSKVWQHRRLSPNVWWPDPRSAASLHQPLCGWVHPAGHGPGVRQVLCLLHHVRHPRWITAPRGREPTLQCCVSLTIVTVFIVWSVLIRLLFIYGGW